MKSIIRIIILILAFCFAVFSQTGESNLPKREPKLIAEFNDRDTEWNKLSISLIMLESSKNSSSIGLIKIRNDKNFRQRLNFLKKAIAFQKADTSRIVFLIVEKQEKDTNILTIQDYAEILEFENCIVIRATDIDKIEKLFRPKTKRNR